MVFDMCMVIVSKGGDKGIDEILMVLVVLYDVGIIKVVVFNGMYVVNVILLVIVYKLIVDILVLKIDMFVVGILMLIVGVGDKVKIMNVEVEDGDMLIIICNKIDVVGCKEGVQVILISFGDDQYLLIVQEKIGVVNVIKFEYVGSDVKLGGLVNSFKQNIVVVDVELIIDGVKVVSVSNIVVDVVLGLILNLKMLGISMVIISMDIVVVIKVMQEFVIVYNVVLVVINIEIKYDVKIKEVFMLIGDVQMCGVISQLCLVMLSVFKDLVGDKFDVKVIGLDIRGYFNVDGILILDIIKFVVVLVSQLEKMCQVIIGDIGGVGKLYMLVDGYVSIMVGKEGVFVVCIKGLNIMLDNIDKCCKDFDMWMKSVEECYKKQFIVLDSLMGKLQQSNMVLQQQLVQLNC